MKISGSHILLIVIITMISACFGNSPKVLSPNDNNKINAKTIAVLPVEIKDADVKAAQLLRSRLFEEVYFKGYSKVPLEDMDKKLGITYENSHNEKNYSITPEILKNTVGADAGLYCKLTEIHQKKLFYSPLKINVDCELRSTDNGEIVWKASSESTERNLYLTHKRLERKIRDKYEMLIEEIVEEIVKKLPDGPNLRS